jgi:hypothetical protein
MLSILASLPEVEMGMEKNLIATAKALIGSLALLVTVQILWIV